MSSNQLNRLLEDFNEVPTDRCWNSIEQQLNIIMPTEINSALQGSNIATSKTGSLISKIAAAPLKVAAISFSVIAVTIASIVSITTLLNPTIGTQITYTAKNNSSVALLDTVVNVNTNRELLSDSIVNKAIKQSFDQPEKITTSPEVVHSSVKAPLVNQSVPNSSIILSNEEEPKPTVQTVNTNKPVSVASTPKPKDPLINDQDADLSIPIKITIPNVFTPNGDGYNDFFVIKGIEDCKDPKLYIKSTNGKLVFQSFNYRNEWEGDNCPDGVYLYYFTYKVNNIEEKMSGRVIIKR